MNRRIVSTATLAAAILVTSGATPASATVITVPVHAMFSKTRMVKLTLRNDSSAPIKLKAGDQSITLDPGKPAPMKLAEGTSITIEEATAQHTAGSLIAQVTTSLEGATLVIH